MQMPGFTPPFTEPADLVATLRRQGSAVLAPDAVCAWAGCDLSQLDALRASWAELPPDDFLKDGGRYRHRRHACYVGDAPQPAEEMLAGDTLRVRDVAHRAHWQPVEYNALHGGMERWFAPVDPAVNGAAAWRRLLQAMASTSGALWPAAGAPQPWYLEAHQFRIDTTDGIGRPTPEGAHRDGVDLVAVFLVGRHGIKGGETRVFDAAGPHGQRFTLTEPWSLLLLDDARVIHESTPIQPVADGEAGWRDTLVLTSRAGGFQGAVPTAPAAH